MAVMVGLDDAAKTKKQLCTTQQGALGSMPPVPNQCHRFLIKGAPGRFWCRSSRERMVKQILLEKASKLAAYQKDLVQVQETLLQLLHSLVPFVDLRHCVRHLA